MGESQLSRGSLEVEVFSELNPFKGEEEPVSDMEANIGKRQLFSAPTSPTPPLSTIEVCVREASSASQSSDPASVAVGDKKSPRSFLLDLYATDWSLGVAEALAVACVGPRVAGIECTAGENKSVATVGSSLYQLEKTRYEFFCLKSPKKEATTKREIEDGDEGGDDEIEHSDEQASRHIHTHIQPRRRLPCPAAGEV
ncbi:hypothetical protein L1887_11580 [Cichorium endivia]|nr:hypothetical protein L1887_11580 [Cichorium endivia]